MRLAYPKEKNETSSCEDEPVLNHQKQAPEKGSLFHKLGQLQRGDDFWNLMLPLEMLSDHMDRLPVFLCYACLLPALSYTTFGLFRTLRAQQ